LFTASYCYGSEFAATLARQLHLPEVLPLNTFIQQQQQQQQRALSLPHYKVML
jgi:hypothetical protein